MGGTHDLIWLSKPGEDDTSTETIDRKFYKLPSKLVRGLELYREIYNNTAIPSSFKVTEEIDRWPSYFHGYNLGLSLQRASAKRNSSIVLQMNDSDTSVEFITHRKSKWDMRDLAGAVQMYRSMNNGSLVVPRNWTIPYEEHWPERCWGIKLGEVMTGVRAKFSSYSAEDIAVLNTAGFIWDPYNRTIESFFDALEAYRSVYGNLDVPRDYVVPCSAPFHEDSWGTKLGMKVSNIRYRGDYPEYRGKFEEIGLSLDKMGFDTRHWDYVYKALKIFKKIYGNVDVPPEWQVPSKEPWPENTWDLKLGYRIHNIRYRGDFLNMNSTYKTLLDELGFTWRRKCTGSRMVVPEATEDYLLRESLSDWSLEYVSFGGLD
jgi:hypothetical protein